MCTSPVSVILPHQVKLRLVSCVMLRQHYKLRLVSCKNGCWSGTQAADEGPPRVRDLVTVTQVQAGELRELRNVLQPVSVMLRQ